MWTAVVLVELSFSSDPVGGVSISATKVVTGKLGTAADASWKCDSHNSGQQWPSGGGSRVYLEKSGYVLL